MQGHLTPVVAFRSLNFYTFLSQSPVLLHYSLQKLPFLLNLFYENLSSVILQDIGLNSEFQFCQNSTAQSYMIPFKLKNNLKKTIIVIIILNFCAPIGGWHYRRRLL